MRLAGKVTIVTGGGNGIGQATAVLFAREGAYVVVADRDTVAGVACVSAIYASGGQALFVEADVTSDNDVAVLVETTVQQPQLYGPARPEDVAHAVLFLSCDESAPINGHNLVIDGGASTRVR